MHYIVLGSNNNNNNINIKMVYELKVAAMENRRFLRAVLSSDKYT